MATAKKSKKTMLTVRAPARLARQLDEAARREDRSRSAEILRRLEASFRSADAQVPA